jgi:hypothetical protein
MAILESVEGHGNGVGKKGKMDLNKSDEEKGGLRRYILM